MTTIRQEHRRSMFCFLLRHIQSGDTNQQANPIGGLLGGSTG